MAVDTLDFEEPVAVLLKEIEALSMLPRTEQRAGEIARLQSRADEIRGELYRMLTPWQRVQISRHINRPFMLDYARMCCDDFIELHGDRHVGDDNAMPAGFATLLLLAMITVTSASGFKP